MKIRYAKEDEKDSIREIWDYCFNDSPKFTDYYFKNRYDRYNTVVVDEDGEIVSSLQLNQYKINLNDKYYDTSYVVGMLTVEKGKDILVRENWRKSNAPILTSRSVEGEFGTGHNAYVIDEYGDMWNTYHARPGVDGPRSSGVRRVHFDIDGLPRLDLVEENDVNKELRTIRTTLVVEK